MKSSIALVALVAALTISIGIPADAFAVDYVNWLYGGIGTENNSGEKGARTYIEIESGSGDHNFDWTADEDHNYHIQVHDSSNYDHNVGYFVNDDAPTTAKFFAETFNSGGTRVLNFESSGAVASDGTNQLFAVHRSSSSWSFYDGTGFGDLQAQYSGGGSSYNTNETYVLGEKGCAGGCTQDEMGDVVTVRFNTALQHTSGTTYTTATWNALDSANMFYQVINTSGSGQNESTSKSAMCPSMTAKGDVQTTIGDNKLDILDESSPSCTSYTADVWN